MKKNPKSPIKKNRCPRCNKFISPRFPMHICEPISTIDIKGTATLEDTDLGVRWGHASGPAIEPPEEEYKIATVELHIDLAQLGGIDDGLQEGLIARLQIPLLNIIRRQVN
jgi:hypothetical protein